MRMEQKNKLAAFDLDGTLFDTTLVNCFSYQKAAELCGCKIEQEAFIREFVGKNYKEFLPVLGITDQKTQEAIHEKKKQLYADFLGSAKKNDHLFSMIEGLRGSYKIALATTASRKNALEILDCFGETEKFDILITQEDVTRLKPDPECYLAAMKQAGVSPEDTIIFEDSEVGMRAAKASGAYAVQVSAF